MTSQPLSFPVPEPRQPPQDISMVGLLDAMNEVTAELVKLREIKSPPPKNGTSFSWRRVGEGVAVVLVAALIIWAIAIQGRVSTLEIERFSKVEASAMEGRIKDVIRETEQGLLDALPPQWLLDRITAMDSRLDRLERARGGDGGTGGTPGGEF